jgi:hypothetical protein
LTRDDSLLILPSDKGNATVVMAVDDYIDKITTLLQTDTYRSL